MISWPHWDLRRLLSLLIMVVRVPSDTYSSVSHRSIISRLRSRLKSQCGLLVVVTNEVFSDGIHYGLETEEYLRLLGQVNVRLSRLSRQVTEVVYGIPVELKAADE